MAECTLTGPRPGYVGPEPAGSVPLIIWDGDCGFCARSVESIRARVGDRAGFEPYQSAAARHPGIPVADFQSAVHLVEPDGRVSRGAEAVLRALATQPRFRWSLLLYLWVPGLAAVSEMVYRFVARHRERAAKAARLLFGEQVGPADHRFTRWIFLRLLGLTALAAFVSLGVQIHGLAGSRGILPVAEFLEAVELRFGDEARLIAPTLCWWSASDAVLSALWITGAALSALLMIGVAPLLILPLLHVLYLSLMTAGQTFLFFQWDILLLETLFLSLFLAPGTLRPCVPSREPAVSLWGLWLLRLLCFKLMWSSGVTKLTWDDPTWWNLTALEHHWWTQPIPTPLAWFAGQLPGWVQRVSCLGMFVIEIALPLLIFAPRRLRALAALGLIGLQVLIVLTGNYGFFNLLAIALCVPLLDDGMWPRRRPVSRPPELGPWTALMRGPLAAVLIAVQIVPLTAALRHRWPPDGALGRLHGVLQPLGLCSDYGLFRTMTTTRPELEIEASLDGVEWRPYVFRFKPGAPDRAPRFFQPHMPRLDWRMWFAALGAERGQLEGWLRPLCERLLDAEPEVLALFEAAPFGPERPRHLRLVLWQYRSAPPRGEDWWQRERLGVIWAVSAR